MKKNRARADEAGRRVTLDVVRSSSHAIKVLICAGAVSLVLPSGSGRLSWPSACLAPGLSGALKLPLCPTTGLPPLLST